MSLTSITVTRTYLEPDGSVARGAVTFQLSNEIEDGTTGETVSPVSLTVPLALVVSGDTSARYDTEAVLIRGTATIGTEQVAAASAAYMINVDMPAASATAGSAGFLDIEFPNYAETTFQKMFHWQSGFLDLATATTDAFIYKAEGQWRSTAAVSSLKVSAINGNLVVGTDLSLEIT